MFLEIELITSGSVDFVEFTFLKISEIFFQFFFLLLHLYCFPITGIRYTPWTFLLLINRNTFYILSQIFFTLFPELFTFSTINTHNQHLNLNLILIKLLKDSFCSTDFLIIMILLSLLSELFLLEESKFSWNLENSGYVLHLHQKMMCVCVCVDINEKRIRFFLLFWIIHLESVGFLYLRFLIFHHYSVFTWWVVAVEWRWKSWWYYLPKKRWNKNFLTQGKCDDQVQ